MKDVVAQVAWEDLKRLCLKKEFQILLKEEGDFAADLLMKVAEHMKVAEGLEVIEQLEAP